MSQPATPQAPQDGQPVDTNKLIAERREKLAALRQQAMKQGVKLAEVARRIVAMADLLG